jgi:hypothetical protein
VIEANDVAAFLKAALGLIPTATATADAVLQRMSDKDRRPL